MSREIKFRAWNKVTETMVDLKKITPLALNIDTDGLFIPCESDGLSIMQYTGLKDKNGVEIYEGDIIKTTHGLQGEVKWNSIDLWWQIPRYEDESAFSSGNYEVIGNIHENPDLLPT